MERLRQEIEPAEAGLDPKALARLDQHFARLVDEGRLPGYLVGVTRAGRVAHLTAYGHRDREAGLPVETDTVWRIYSMTKPVTSVAALMLVEEGRLALSDPVSRYIPSFGEMRVYESGSGASGASGASGGSDIRTRPAEQPVLVHHLMTHTAGLTFGFYHSHPVDALYRGAGLESSVLPGTDLATTCEAYARLPLQFEPGTQWNYSVASNVLGRVIEIASGRPLDEFLTERVFRPLGMSDAGFHVTGEQAGRLAELYEETEDGSGITPIPGLPLHGRPRLLSGSGGLVATAHDYHRFMEFLRRGGELDGTRLLSRESLATMTANHLPGNADLRTYGSPAHRFPGNAGVGFGLGVSVVTDPRITDTPSTAGTYGWSGVATTTFWVDPRHDLTVQFMTQVRPTSSNAVFPELRRLVHEAVRES
ncbi:serine hydrolase domain-containing protein [Streptomyces poonensis]|uniref:Serine hydrolase n=1 Tax=Streptomyces poonensis TaxID=68255 RepID=A0A918PE44_9ACTN|nr:serine hydrolase domain-containing protein [Streptomyces poonensis]GGZ02376.1 serine hydrolase [Streptomyces poonensis]GLJ93242.1 serine hydrolase [Streptomyces poonensis]